MSVAALRQEAGASQAPTQESTSEHWTPLENLIAETAESIQRVRLVSSNNGMLTGCVCLAEEYIDAPVAAPSARFTLHSESFNGDRPKLSSSVLLVPVNGDEEAKTELGFHELPNDDSEYLYVKGVAVVPTEHLSSLQRTVIALEARQSDLIQEEASFQPYRDLEHELFKKVGKFLASYRSGKHNLSEHDLKQFEDLYSYYQSVSKKMGSSFLGALEAALQKMQEDLNSNLQNLGDLTDPIEILDGIGDRFNELSPVIANVLAKRTIEEYEWAERVETLNESSLELATRLNKLLTTLREVQKAAGATQDITEKPFRDLRVPASISGIDPNSPLKRVGFGEDMFAKIDLLNEKSEAVSVLLKPVPDKDSKATYHVTTRIGGSCDIAFAGISPEGSLIFERVSQPTAKQISDFYKLAVDARKRNKDAASAFQIYFDLEDLVPYLGAENEPPEAHELAGDLARRPEEFAGLHFSEDKLENEASLALLSYHNFCVTSTGFFKHAEHHIELRFKFIGGSDAEFPIAFEFLSAEETQIILGSTPSVLTKPARPAVRRRGVRKKVKKKVPRKRALPNSNRPTFRGQYVKLLGLEDRHFVDGLTLIHGLSKAKNLDGRPRLGSPFALLSLKPLLTKVEGLTKFREVDLPHELSPTMTRHWHMYIYSGRVR